MQIIVNTKTGVVIASAITAETNIHGDILVNRKTTGECIFNNADKSLAYFGVDALPTDYADSKYLYNLTSGFTPNNDYLPYVDPMQRIAYLEHELGIKDTKINTLEAHLVQMNTDVAEFMNYVIETQSQGGTV